MPVQIQDSLIVMCKNKSMETHLVKTKKIKIQTAKRLGKKNLLKDQQLVHKLAKLKYASWLHQQFTSPRFWKTPKKAFDEFDKISSENKQKKFVKEQILIIHLGLGFEEAYHPWYKEGDDYTALQLNEIFVKVCLPLIKTCFSLFSGQLTSLIYYAPSHIPICVSFSISIKAFNINLLSVAACLV